MARFYSIRAEPPFNLQLCMGHPPPCGNRRTSAGGHFLRNHSLFEFVNAERLSDLIVSLLPRVLRQCALASLGQYRSTYQFAMDTSPDAVHSTHDQKTLPMQLSAMRDYAKRRRWAIEVHDVGSGATTRLRERSSSRWPGGGEIDLVLVWRPDRLGRSALRMPVPGWRKRKRR